MKIFIENSITSLKTLILPEAIKNKVFLVEHWKDIDKKSFGKELDGNHWLAFGSFHFTHKCEGMGATRLDNIDEFHFSSYCNRLNDCSALLNSDFKFYPQNTSFEKMQLDFRHTKKLFLKPNGPFKDFEAKVYESYDSRFLESHPCSNQFIIAAKPKQILAECRFFKIKNTILSAGFYKWSDKIISSLVEEKAIKSIGEYHTMFPEFCVIDMAWTEDGNAKVVEINSIHNSGFYSLDMMAFLENIYKIYEQDNCEKSSTSSTNS
jgi:hypothetical protein